LQNSRDIWNIFIRVSSDNLLIVWRTVFIARYNNWWTNKLVFAQGEIGRICDISR